MAEWQQIGGRLTLFVSVEEVPPAEWQRIGGTLTLFVSTVEEEPEPEPEPEPGGARFRGSITWVTPKQLVPGDILDLHISFKAYVDTLWEQVRGWDTRLTATLDGLTDSDTQGHLGKEGHRDDEVLSLGIMPESSIYGIVTLEGRGRNLIGLPTNWQEIDSVEITVFTPGEAKEFPMGALLLGSGAALVLLTAIKEKGPST